MRTPENRRKAPVRRASKRIVSQSEQLVRLFPWFVFLILLLWITNSRTGKLSSTNIQKELQEIRKGKISISILKKLNLDKEGEEGGALKGLKDKDGQTVRSGTGSSDDSDRFSSDDAFSQSVAKETHRLVDNPEEIRGLKRSGIFTRFGSRRKKPKKRWLGPYLSWNPVKENLVTTRKSFKKETLDFTIARENLQRVELDFNRFGIETATIGTTPLEATKGGICPEFEYSYEGFPDVASCWRSPIEDMTRSASLSPKNCPNLDWQCVQETDFQPHEKWAPQVFLIHNAYVNVAGQVFNQTHFFDHNACAAEQSFRHVEGKTTVHYFKELISVADWFAWNARHNLLDLFPLFVSLDGILPKFLEIPIAFGHRLTHRRNQQEQMSAQGISQLLGFDLMRLNSKIVSGTDLFFAEKLFLPLHQRCGRPSRALWQHIRSRHFLPAAGLPMYTPEFLPALSSTEESDFATGDDWIVLLGLREEKKPLVHTLKLFDELKRIFPADRVEIYKEGSLSMKKRKAYLNRAKLLVAVHDNLLADMVFMPPGGFVYELRPRVDPDPTFHHLAEVCGLDYYLTLLDGRRTGKGGAGLKVRDYKIVYKILGEIAQKIMKSAAD